MDPLDELLRKDLGAQSTGVTEVHAVELGGTVTTVLFDRREEAFVGRDFPGEPAPLLRWSGRRHLACVSTGFAIIGGKRHDAMSLVGAGIAVLIDGVVEIPIEPGIRVVVEHDGVRYLVQACPPDRVDARKMRSFLTALAIGLAAAVALSLLLFAAGRL